MKKLYTFLFLLFAFNTLDVNAQCTPDPNNLTLITPDTTTNFVSGTVGQPYSQVVLIHPPTDSTVQLPGLPLPVLVSDIQVELISFSGLPPGLTNQCNPVNCIFQGGVSGCSEISGIPTTAGTYPLFAIIGASGTIFGGSVTVGPIIDTLLAYRIIIQSGVGVNELQNDLGFINIASSFTSQNAEVQFNARSTDNVIITVSNTIGEVMSIEGYKPKNGINAFTVNTSALANGVYILTLRNKNQVIAGKFLVSR